MSLFYSTCQVNPNLDSLWIWICIHIRISSKHQHDTIWNVQDVLKKSSDTSQLNQTWTNRTSFYSTGIDSLHWRWALDCLIIFTSWHPYVPLSNTWFLEPTQVCLHPNGISIRSAIFAWVLFTKTHTRLHQDIHSNGLHLALLAMWAKTATYFTAHSDIFIHIIYPRNHVRTSNFKSDSKRSALLMES